MPHHRQYVNRCRQPDLTASINETMQFFPDRPIIKYGLISAFLYWTITSVLALSIDGSMLLLSFYTPGTIFGICLFLGLDTLKIRNRQFPLSIILLSTIFYAAVILFCNKNITFSIQTRHFLSGGLGAILLFLAISFSYKVNFALYDYLLAFVVGLGTTFFMWTDKFGNFNPWLMFLCIGLWQIAISFLLDRKLDKATQ